MNCPKCKIQMAPGEKVECRTGNAQKHKCVNCGANHFEQLTRPGRYEPRPLAQTLQLIASASSL